MGDTVMQQRQRRAREHAWSLRVEINQPRDHWWLKAVCRGLPCEHVTPDHCTGCPVRIDCLTAAHTEETDYYYHFYVRGGFHAVQRQRMWRYLHTTTNTVSIHRYEPVIDVATGNAEPPPPPHGSVSAIA